MKASDLAAVDLKFDRLQNQLNRAIETGNTSEADRLRREMESLESDAEASLFDDLCDD